MNLSSWKHTKILIILLILTALITACNGEQPAPAPTATSITAKPTQEEVEAVEVETAVPPIPTTEATDVTPSPPHPLIPSSLTVLYTNDEHGWMEGVTPEQSAAHLMGVWRDEEGYEPDGPFLILSGGDMWTGPAISTWFDGAGMVEVMNSMGYAAAAVGNHEFDFGLDALTLRAEEANFPFLSANMRYADGSFPTDIGIEPYTIVSVGDIQVGIIGLTTQLTPQTTNPTNVADFEFIDYETALREVVPEVKAEGAEIILIPGHLCRPSLNLLANKVADLGIHMIGGGHCNELFAVEVCMALFCLKVVPAWPAMQWLNSPLTMNRGPLLMLNTECARIQAGHARPHCASDCV